MSDQRIFSFQGDDATPCYVDPVTVERLLWQHTDGDPQTVLDQARDDKHGTDGEGRPLPPRPEVYHPATVKLVSAIRAAFELPPVDRKSGRGYTEQRCLDVLDEFLRWQQAQKKTGGSSPTLPPATGPQS